jgi:hypothetical protein
MNMGHDLRAMVILLVWFLESRQTTKASLGTGITKLLFPAESPITTTGAFVLTIDSTLAKTVVLPRWVVQQGPWSLV